MSDEVVEDGVDLDESGYPPCAKCQKPIDVNVPFMDIPDYETTFHGECLKGLDVLEFVKLTSIGDMFFWLAKPDPSGKFEDWQDITRPNPEAVL